MVIVSHVKAAPLNIDPNTGVFQLHMGSFVTGMLSALLPLVNYVNGNLRNHPEWGELMPYHIQPFNGASPGHIVRFDILMTGGKKPQFVVNELDFIPSGRGFLIDSLDPGGQATVLRTFAEWYESMGYREVRYATGSVTVCDEESHFFSERLRQHSGLDIHAINIDEDSVPTGALVDRLFYRSELVNPLPGGLQIATAEPWLDSKMLFAVIHDPSMTETLMKNIGPGNLQFLRSTLAETYLIERIAEKPFSNIDLIGQMANQRKDWVLKPTEVEGDTNWGSRGVVIGSKVSQHHWLQTLSDPSNSKKPLGNHPIIQRMAHSRDFTGHWNTVVEGDAKTASPERFGKPVNETTKQPASKQVHARLGVYMMLDNTNSETFVVPYGMINLRQDPLVHGASDSLFSGFKIVQ